jgi:hypothetical protein
MVSHDAKAEEYQVPVPQQPLAKLQEMDERLAPSVSDLHYDVIDSHLEEHLHRREQTNQANSILVILERLPRYPLGHAQILHRHSDADGDFANLVDEHVTTV